MRCSAILVAVAASTVSAYALDTTVYPTTTEYPTTDYPTATDYPTTDYPTATDYPTTDYATPTGYATTEYTTTEVVTSHTTYCAEPTEYVQCGTTYTVTEPTTLTITDCPCTLTMTYSTEYPIETECTTETSSECTTETTSECTTETTSECTTETTSECTTETTSECTETSSGYASETSECTETSSGHTMKTMSKYPVPTATGVANKTTASPTYLSPVESSTNVYEGAANRATVAGGALVGVLALAAYLL